MQHKELIKLSFENESVPPVFLRKNTTDFIVFDQIIQRQDYSIDLNFDPKIILDCGANIGLAAIYFKNEFPDAKILCIEPEFDNFCLLQKNVTEYNDIICYHAGIWYRSAYLSVKDMGFGNWGFIVKESCCFTDNCVQAITINNLLEEHKIDCIDILKIDIEGAEKELFSENYDVWLPKTKVIIIELHDRIKQGCSQSVFKALSNYDYFTKIKGENIIIYLNGAIH